MYIIRIDLLKRLRRNFYTKNVFELGARFVKDKSTIAMRFSYPGKWW